LRNFSRGSPFLGEATQAQRIVKLREHDASGTRYARHLRKRASDVGHVRKNFEAHGHVERTILEGQGRHASLDDIEPARTSELEHPIGQIDALRRARELRNALEKEPGTASALEHVAALAISFGELDFEIVDERVIAV